MKRTVIAGSNPIHRQGLGILLPQTLALRLAAEFDNCETLSTRYCKLNPDFLILDVHLTGGCPLELIKHFHAATLAVRIVAFSLVDDDYRGILALKAGVHGFIGHKATPDVWIHALKHVASGHRYICSSLADRIADTLAVPINKKGGFESLSQMERLVLIARGEGKTNEEICKQYGKAPSTIGTHFARAKEKLDLTTLANVVRYVEEWKRSHPTTLIS